MALLGRYCFVGALILGGHFLVTESYRQERGSADVDVDIYMLIDLQNAL